MTIDIGDHMGLHPAQQAGSRPSPRVRRAAPDLWRHACDERTIPATASRGRGTSQSHSRASTAGLDVSGAQPIGFELCGPTQQSCHFASASVSGNTVDLAVPQGAEPTRVRYCWGNGPVCTLYDAMRIPAVPFELALAAALARAAPVHAAHPRTKPVKAASAHKHHRRQHR